MNTLFFRRDSTMKQYDGFVTVTAEDIGCDPRIPKGAQLLCSEKIKPQNGDYVLVKRGSAPPFIRGYFVREDGSILLKSFNKDADSYVASAQALNAAGIMVVIRMEHDFPAASRVVIPEPEKAESVLPQEKVSASPLPVNSDLAELLTFDEAQALLKVRRTKMYALLRSGELRASKIGKLWRVERASIQQYLAAKTYKN